jgi:hypothetical protein
MTADPENPQKQLDDKVVEVGRQILTHLQSGAVHIKKKVDDIPAVQAAKTKLDDFVGLGLTAAQMAETKPDEWKEYLQSPGVFNTASKVKEWGAGLGFLGVFFPPAFAVSGAMVVAASTVMAREKTKAEQQLVEEKGAELKNSKARIGRNLIKAILGSNS